MLRSVHLRQSLQGLDPVGETGEQRTRCFALLDGMSEKRLGGFHERWIENGVLQYQPGCTAAIFPNKSSPGPPVLFKYPLESIRVGAVKGGHLLVVAIEQGAARNEAVAKREIRIAHADQFAAQGVVQFSPWFRRIRRILSQGLRIRLPWHNPAMQDVLDFWFRELQPSDWYARSVELDARIRTRFETIHQQVAAGETSEWRDTPGGRLAEIIVLDQFSRNMFRDQSQAFATDPMALALSQEAIRSGADRELDDTRRAFLYMPFMHSESRRIHERALVLFRDLPNLDYELRHKAIIDRFGRYPHRNAALGRTSTAEEIEWMARNPGF